MANAGFKGTTLRVAEISLQGDTRGARVSFRILFEDSSGVVHAHTNHVLEMKDDDKVKESAQGLVRAVTEWASRAHFKSSTTPKSQTKEAIRGISESLSIQGPDPIGGSEESD